MQRKGLDIFLLVLKILIPIALVLFIVWAGIDLVDAYIKDQEHIGESGYIQGFGLSFALLLVLSIVYNGAVAIVSLIGLIISICFKSSDYRKRHIVSFVILLLAPVVATFALLGVYELIPLIAG